MSKSTNNKPLIEFLFGAKKLSDKEVINSDLVDQMLEKQWDNPDEVKNNYEPFDKDKVRDKIITQINSRKSIRSIRPQNTFTLIVKRAAIVIFALASIATLYYVAKENVLNPNNNLVEKSNDTGFKSKLFLADGSTVWLNSESTVKYAEKNFEKNRKVYLSGEAYFIVKSDMQNPFEVITSEFTVRATGTEFNVSAYNSDDINEATLFEGKVAVTLTQENGAQEIDLSVNQKAVFSKSKSELEILNVHPEVDRAWIEGKLMFDNADLSYITNKLERWYNITIQVDKEIAEKHHFTITIKNESIEEVLELLRLTSSIRYNKSAENEYTISPE